jgi:hypothetical protein
MELFENLMIDSPGICRTGALNLSRITSNCAF